LHFAVKRGILLVKEVIIVDLFGNAAILELRAYRSEFQKKETVYVPPRPFHSLTLRLSGAISIRTDGEALLSAAPCITYVPKGVGYHTEVLESGTMLVAHFATTGEAERDPRVLVHTPRDPEAYRRLFGALLDAATPGQDRSYRALSLFYSVLAQLEQELESKQQPVPPRIREAKQIFDSEFSEPQLSVASVADRLALSAVYLRRAFKTAYGAAPLAYLQALRLSRAKTLLESGYYTVTEVAEKCGYDSLSYFSAAFRKMTGLSPLAYARSTCFLHKK
jgi:AraC-like DNA-binding protein